MTNYIPVFILNELIILPGQEIKIDLNNEYSKKIIKESSKLEVEEVLVIAPKNSKESSPSIEDLPRVGVITKIKSKLVLSNGNLRIVLRGKKRVTTTKYYQNKTTGILKCSYEEVKLPKFDGAKETAILRKLKSLTEEYIRLNQNVSNSIVSSLEETNDLNKLTDIITSFMPFSFPKKLYYMETINPLLRAGSLITDLSEEIHISNIDKEIDEKLQEKLESSQREYILKEKLKEINNELGNDREKEILELNEKVNNLNISDSTKNKLLYEIKKYSASSDYSAESAVLKNYIDTVINLPWEKESIDESDPKEILKKLNETHYGLDEIKNRIVEYVTIKKINPNIKSPIICLVGYPGTGKTSIAISIAKALNRKFYKISVGGLNDSTELIGSRKTYLGACPGKIMQGIIKCDVKNPLILIDEVDKMVKDYKGDPASTMLEIIDESQNKYFIDNYIEEAFDLSKVMFILTANNKDDIPYPLLDRMEIIDLSCYSMFEKIDIAKNYLLKNIFDEYQVNFKISKEVIEYIVTKYTKEPGVRELKRILEKLVRKVSVYESSSKSITISHVNKYLGKEINSFLPTIRDYGISNTLAYTTLGGILSHVEVSRFKGEGKISITGSAGDVLKESVLLVRSFLESEYDLDSKEYDIHVHFVSAAQKKDGPSAGISIAVAMLSLFEKKVISSSVAFTGELTLKGDILPIGALKEKLIVAYEEDVKCVYIPRANEADLLNVPAYVFDKINVKLVSNFSEIYDDIFKL